MKTKINMKQYNNHKKNKKHYTMNKIVIIIIALKVQFKT